MFSPRVLVLGVPIPLSLSPGRVSNDSGCGSPVLDCSDVRVRLSRSSAGGGRPVTGSAGSGAMGWTDLPFRTCSILGSGVAFRVVCSLLTRPWGEHFRIFSSGLSHFWISSSDHSRKPFRGGLVSFWVLSGTCGVPACCPAFAPSWLRVPVVS